MDRIARSWIYLVSATHAVTRGKSIVLLNKIPKKDAERLYGAGNFSPVAEACSINQAYAYARVVGNRPPVEKTGHAKRLYQQEPVDDFVEDTPDSEDRSNINPNRKWPRLAALLDIVESPGSPERIARESVDRAKEGAYIRILSAKGSLHSMSARTMETLAERLRPAAGSPDYEPETRQIIRHPGHESPENPYSEPSGEGPESI